MAKKQTSGKERLELVYVPIKDLKAADYNPRTISKEELKKLGRSMDELVFADPIIVNMHPKRKNVVIGGHQRLRAAKEILKLTEVPVVYVNLDPRKEKLLNVALNKISGEWDYSKLSELLVELDTAPDIDLTGYDRIDIDGIQKMTDEVLNREEKAKELKKNMIKAGINPKEADAVSKLFENSRDQAKEDLPDVDVQGVNMKQRKLIAFWIDDDEVWQYLRSVYSTGRDIEQDDEKLLRITENAKAHDQKKLIAITTWYHEVYLPAHGKTTEE